MNVSELAVGSWPAMIVKAPNSPGLRPCPACAVQVIRVTASVMSPSSVTIGFASVELTSVCVHPGTGSTSTDAMGVSVGS